MTTPVTVVANVQTDGLEKVRGAMTDIQKTMNLLNGSFASYSKNLKSILGQLETVSRAGGGAGQTIRDLQLAAGGSTIAGRVRQSMSRGQISDMKQTEQVLVSQFVNDYRSILKGMTKSVQAALVKDYAASRQTIAAQGQQLAAQIEAQRARTAYAAQINGTRGLNRDRLVQGARSVGINELGTLKQEKSALDALLATEQKISLENQSQIRDTRALLSLQEQLKRATDARFTSLKEQQRAMSISQRMGQSDIAALTASARGDSMGVANANAKREALRLEQMILQGVKQESAEYQTQLGLIRQAAAEKFKLQQAGAQTLAQAREQNALERSRKFAGGDPNMRETVVNNMVGARRAAASDEGRASLLGLQSNLLMNYALIGSVTGALTGMTSAVVDLDAQMRQLQAISGATNAEYLKMKDSIIDASTNTKFSAVELAEAATLLAQVGMSAAQIQDTLPAISNFAMAVGTDMKNAVDIVTTTLTVFNMATADTERVTNVLTEALNRSKLSMDQLVLGFQYAANITADAGGTFEELTAVLAGMSQAGIRSGSMLGTGLRQIMISLASPTEEVSSLLKDLGLSMNDVDVRTQGLVGVLENFSKSGITASQAMGAFETRTAAALIAAVNQIGFMKDLQEQMVYTNAAEEAARVQKESLKNSTLELKNSFLAFVNDAATPVVGVLIAIAQKTKELMSALSFLQPLMVALGTAMLLFAGAAVIGSVVRLTSSFLAYSGVMAPMSAMFLRTTASANLFMFTLTNVARAEGVAAAGAWGLRAALTALAAHPVALALTAIVGVAAVLTNGFGLLGSATDRHRSKMDELQTEYDESQSKMTNYSEVMSQIESSLARLSSRSETLKGDQQSLKIETMNAAVQFNQYGASIRSTTLDLGQLTTSLYAARQGVMDLMYAEAQRAGLAAQRLATEADSNLRSEASGATGSFGGRLTGQGMTQANFIKLLERSGKSREEIIGLARDFGTVRGTGQRNGATSAEGSAQASIAASNITRFLRGITDQGTRSRFNVDGAANSFDRISSSGMESASQRSIERTANRQIGEIDQRRSPGFQALERNTTPGIMVGGTRVAFTASSFQSQMDDIDAWTRLGRRPDGTAFTPADARRERNGLFARGREALRTGQLGADQLRAAAANSGDPSFVSAADTVLSGSGSQAIGELTGALRTRGTAQDTQDTAFYTDIQKAAKGNVDASELLRVARSEGYDFGGATDREGILKYSTDQLASISQGYSQDQRLGINDPMTALRYGTETLAENAPGRQTGGGSSAVNAAEKAARDAKKLTDAAASSFERLSQASDKSAKLILKDIDENTTPEQLEDVLNRATEAFDASEGYSKEFYDTKLRGLTTYKNALVAAGAISQPELDDLNSEILNVQIEMEEAASNQAEQINDALTSALSKIPDIAQPFTTLLDAVDKGLRALEVELAERMSAIEQLTASRAAVGEGLGVAVRQGRISGAEAEGYDARYQKLLDAADAGASIDRMENLKGRRAFVGNALSSEVNVNGTAIPLEQIERAYNSQKAFLGTLEMGTKEYTIQSLILKDLEANVERMYGYREQEYEINQLITAEQDRQAALASIQTATIQERMGNMVEGFMNANGYNKDPFTAMLEGLPGVLTEAQTALGTFFSSVLTGTASVGDAFRTMGATILQAMMDVVASEIAKTFMNIALSLFKSAMGAPTAPTATTSGGVDLSNLSSMLNRKEGGYINAKTGMAVRGRDSVKINAMPGEFLLRKSAVDAIGVDNLDAINAAGNRAVSGQNSVKPVVVNQPPAQERPLNVYVVSPDRTPPPSRDEIIVMVQDDMINRGPIYKTTKAVQQGAI